MKIGDKVYMLDDHAVVQYADGRVANCCCPDCDYEIQPGHFLCSQPDLELLEAEKSKIVVRTYNDRWEWIGT